MKTTLMISFLFAGALLLGACSDSQPAQTGGPGADDGASTEDAAAALASAAALLQASRDAGHAWTTTQTQLDIARQALDANDLELARTEADRAAALAEASLAQAKTETDAWSARFPTKTSAQAPAKASEQTSEQK